MSHNLSLVVSFCAAIIFGVAFLRVDSYWTIPAALITFIVTYAIVWGRS